MRHAQRVRVLKAWHMSLARRLEMPLKLPKHVDIKKLEMACDNITNEYEWVLRKRSNLPHN